MTILKKKINVGIIGLGRLGIRYAENFIHRIKNAELVAACSVAPRELEYAASELGIPQLFDDYENMLNHRGIEAVFIVSPTSEHTRQMIAALETGHHVFCEKPLATTVEECERVEAAAAQRPDQIAVVGFVRRFDPSYRYAKEKIESGAIGAPIIVRSQTVDKDSTVSFQIDYVANSGGIFHDFNIHDIDLARWFLGSEIKSVYAVGGAYKHKEFGEIGDADNVMTMCVFENGALANISASRAATHGHDTRTEVIGTEGILSIGRPAALNRVEISDRFGIRKECVETFYDRFQEAFLSQAKEFIDCILENRKPELTLRDATMATKAAAAFTTSFREQRVVEI